MSFVSVKCPNCNGQVQFDDAKSNCFCLYCGTKLIYEENKSKIEISGCISVDGVIALEKMLQNANTFRLLGNDYKEKEILTSVTNRYPEDYRAWWNLAQQFLRAPYSSNNNHAAHGPEFLINDSWKYVRNALITAPKDKKPELTALASEYYQSFIPYYKNIEEMLKEKQRKEFEDFKKMKAIKEEVEEGQKNHIRSVYSKVNEQYKSNVKKNVLKKVLAISFLVVSIVIEACLVVPFLNSKIWLIGVVWAGLALGPLLTINYLLFRRIKSKPNCTMIMTEQFNKYGGYDLSSEMNRICRLSSLNYDEKEYNRQEAFYSKNDVYKTNTEVQPNYRNLLQIIKECKKFNDDGLTNSVTDT